MIYYHNPKCRKSREGLTFLKDRNIQPEIRDYLKERLTHHELRSILEKLDMRPDELMRKTRRYTRLKLREKAKR
ncbi:MAG: hypothetical protein CM15mP65_15310 [Crocinitomicaceae bacterium]|nr:MAG: hypothetical protein CM15mP65_15310 [Crocinitomicaceae bacterium]